MVSVADVVGFDTLHLQVIVDARSDAQVRWVATSELADPTPFLEGGEILLTTGLIERDDAGWFALVSGLVDSGAVALGFGVGLSHPTVPPSLKDAAEQLSLNLFVVPRPVPFIAVSRAVAGLLWSAERDADHQSLLHQRALTNAALHPGEKAGVLHTLAHIVKGDVVLATWDGRVLSHSGSASAASAVVQYAMGLIERLHAQGPRSVATDIRSDRRTTVYPVGLATPANSYLVVASESTGGASQRTAVTMAIALLTLEDERTIAERDASRRIRAGAMALTLRSEVVAARELVADLSPHTRIPAHRARIVRARGDVIGLNRALDSIEHDATELGYPLAAIITDESEEAQLVIVIGSGSPPLEHLKSLVNRLLVGIGPERPINAMTHSDEGARHALSAATDARPLVLWTELSAQGFDGLVSSEAAHIYAANLLDGVLSHPEAPELIECLRAYLVHNGSIGPAANSLGIHRNTLRHRLDVAEASLGRSLSDPQLRADLWFALKHLPSGAL